MYRLIVGGLTLVEEKEITCEIKRFDNQDEAYAFAGNCDEFLLEVELASKNGLSVGDLKEGETWYKVEYIDKRNTYRPLKTLADEVEELRLSLFNDKTHRENVKEFIDDETFNRVDDELFSIHSNLRRLYYEMISED